MNSCPLDFFIHEHSQISWWNIALFVSKVHTLDIIKDSGIYFSPTNEYVQPFFIWFISTMKGFYMLYNVIISKYFSW